MATIESSIQMFSGMNDMVGQINGSIILVIAAFGRMDQAALQAFRGTGAENLRLECSDTRSEIIDMEMAIENVKDQEDQLNESIEKGKNQALNLKDAYEKISKVLGKVGIDLKPADILSNANDYRVAGNTVATSTGLQGGELEQAKQSVKNLYVDNVGQSMEDVAQNLSTVYQLTGQTGDVLEDTTRAGMLLSDTFGFHVTDSIQTAQVLQRQFGVSGGEAFDLIVQGAQAGLNKNGDMLASIKEYSSSFQTLGMGGTEMFNVLINGSQGGVFSIQNMGDAVREFSARAGAGTDEARAGLEALGLDADKMTAAFQTGGEASRAAFQETINALNQANDPTVKNMAGASLFGNAWQGMGSGGIEAFANMDGPVRLTMENLQGINHIKYDDASSALASLGRTINTGLAGLAGGAVETLTRYISDFTTGLQGDAGEVQGVFGRIGQIAGFVGSLISENWGFIEPIILAVVAAMGAYQVKGLVSQGLDIAMAAGKLILAVATGRLAKENAKEAASQWGVNSALLSCPIFWIVMGIIALIGAVYLVIGAFNQMTGSSISATGVISGAFAFVGAVIWNIFLGLLTLVMGVIQYLVNHFLAFANFFTNVFKDPIGSVIHLFANLGDAALSVIENIAKAMDFVFGTNFADTVAGWRENLSAMAEDAAKRFGNGEYEETFEAFDYEKVLEEHGISLDRIDYGDAIKNAYEGNEDGFHFDGFEGLTEKFEKFQGLPEENNEFGAKEQWEGIENNTANTASNTAKMTDSMDVLDEDLKYMREAAEQEIINRFTLADLKIDVNNNNTLTTKTDFDDLGRVFAEVTDEIINTAAEGAF